MATIKYKNMEVDASVGRMIKYMAPVEDNRELLYNLSNNWDSLSLLSQLGDAGMNMSEIKNNFTKLSSKLINHLSIELLDKCVATMNFKAQVAVDIVIRNLFERTADIGFLATDEDIREFLRQNRSKYATHFPENLAQMRKRFLEYVQKYSVYFDIVLMNQNGDILASLDESTKVSKSQDRVIKEVLSTQKEYVESYKYHDFLPKEKKSLVYAYRVTETNDPDSEVLGILALCFKFDDEMAGVFANLKEEASKEAIMLLDASGEVIATSDCYHIPIGAKMQIIKEERYRVVTFGGRDYLAKSCQTNGYQGFEGLGWYGHIMVPLTEAFEEIGEDRFEIEEELLLSILQNTERFSDELKSIPLQGIAIQNNLNRAIWNGNVKQSSSNNNHNKQFSRALLQEIRKTGENTKSIIGSSIANLTKTIVLGDSLFYADLIVDIMDRNLYERANDCRWWALTSDFRSLMSKESLTPYDTERMNNILQYINGLYTVYTNLIIFDKNGIVRAVSNQSEYHLIGKRLYEPWVDETLQLGDSAHYRVSDFKATSLYGGEHTYIYGASIRSLDEKRVVGGIGIVFDSTKQFASMIEESLPKEASGEPKEGFFATLITEDMQIIASSNAAHKVGGYIDLDSRYTEIGEGESISEIVVYHDKYYALGVKCSKGYREYKSPKDDYSQRVYSLFFSYISDVVELAHESQKPFMLERDVMAQNDASRVDVASFMIGKQWLGLEAKDVVEAVSISELKSTVKIDKDHHFKGTLIYNDAAVMVIDIKKFIQESVDEEYNEIVIIRYGSPENYLGILVNALGDIPEVEIERIKKLQAQIIGSGTLVDCVVFPSRESSSKEVLSILSVDKIISELVKPEQAKLLPSRLRA